MSNTQYLDANGNVVDVSVAKPLPVTGGSGGGGDASAANQTTEIARLTSILSQLTTGVSAVAGTLVPIQATFTRPADTTAYTALDAVNSSTSAPAAFAFAGASRVNGGSGYITGARLITNNAACPARHRIHLSKTNPTSPIADNAPYTTDFTGAANGIAPIDMPAMNQEASGGTAARSFNNNIRIPYNTASGANTIYAQLEVLDGYTPTSGQQFLIELFFDQN